MTPVFLQDQGRQRGDGQSTCPLVGFSQKKSAAREVVYVGLPPQKKHALICAKDGKPNRGRHSASLRGGAVQPLLGHFVGERKPWFCGPLTSRVHGLFWFVLGKDHFGGKCVLAFFLFHRGSRKPQGRAPLLGSEWLTP